MSVSHVRGGGHFEAIASYSRAVRAGDLIAVSGTAALGQDGVALHPGDLYNQTKTAFSAALDAVRELGAQPFDVIRTRIFLAPGSDWRDAVRAHGELFASIDPANTTLFAAGFIPEACLVEVEVDAVVQR